LDSYSSSLAAFDKKVTRVPRGFSLKVAEINQLTLDTVYDGLLREKVLVLVKKEYYPNGRKSKIDLYIPDGSKQIVIENTLNASDQVRPVKRYIEAADTKIKVKRENTIFLFIKKIRCEPLPSSLGMMELDDSNGFLVSKDGESGEILSVRYLNLHYVNKKNCKKSGLGLIFVYQSWKEISSRKILCGLFESASQL
jgi:hypothetical protein